MALRRKNLGHQCLTAWLAPSRFFAGEVMDFPAPICNRSNLAGVQTQKEKP
jgi:hypothetical protein